MRLLVALLVLLALGSWAIHLGILKLHGGVPRVQCQKTRHTTQSDTRKDPDALVQALARREGPRRTRETPACIRQLHALCTQPFEWSVLIQAGDVYARGDYPTYRPSVTVAELCYRAAAEGPDPHVAGMAQARFIETRVAGIPEDDVLGRAIPRQYADTLLVQARRHAQTARTFYHVPRPFERKNVEKRTPEKEPPKTPRVPDDPQNVHDHGVVQGLVRYLKQLPEGAPDAREEVLAHALDSPDLSDDDKARVVMVLDSLGSEPHSRLGVSEMDVLGRVYAKLPAASRDILVRQLASGVEDGLVVCSTGKIARMLGSFDGLGVLSAGETKPMWVVKEELSRIAVQVRDQFPDAGPNVLRQEFRRRAAKDYTHLNPTVLEPILEAYCLGF